MGPVKDRPESLIAPRLDEMPPTRRLSHARKMDPDHMPFTISADPVEIVGEWLVDDASVRLVHSVPDEVPAVLDDHEALMCDPHR